MLQFLTLIVLCVNGQSFEIVADVKDYNMIRARSSTDEYKYKLSSDELYLSNTQLYRV